MRPIVLNGIEDVVTRPDLADRAIFLNLEAIAEEPRKPEAEILRAFISAQPVILGALLDGVATGLRQLPRLQLGPAPAHGRLCAVGLRVRDGVFGPEGTFLGAYAAISPTPLRMSLTRTSLAPQSKPS